MSGTIGDNVYRASGVIAASAGGGAVSWDTATIKTTGFTAAAGIGYFCNTTGGSFTVTLPAAPAAGDMIGIKDYLNTFDTSALTLGRNSKPIESESLDGVLQTEGDEAVLIFMDDTVGWKIISHAAKEDLAFPTYIAATGGTEATSGDYKIHVFTANACFTVTSVGNAAGSNSVCYMVAGGGGGGAGPNPKGGGGGAGGWRASAGTTNGSYCAGPSPLVAGVAAIGAGIAAFFIAFDGVSAVASIVGLGGEHARDMMVNMAIGMNDLNKLDGKNLTLVAAGVAAIGPAIGIFFGAEGMGKVWKFFVGNAIDEVKKGWDWLFGTEEEPSMIEKMVEMLMPISKLNNVNSFYFCRMENYLVIFDLLYLQSINYPFKWEWRAMPASTEFKKTETVDKYVGYINVNDGELIKIFK